MWWTKIGIIVGWAGDTTRNNQKKQVGTIEHHVYRSAPFAFDGCFRILLLAFYDGNIQGDTVRTLYFRFGLFHNQFFKF